jgi:hypothetical protein
MRQLHAIGVARRRVQVDPEPCAGGELDLAGGEGADAQLRPLQVERTAIGGRFRARRRMT